MWSKTNPKHLCPSIRYTCARWNWTTSPLRLYRFEAGTHHQAGSCTQKDSFWCVGGSFLKRRPVRDPRWVLKNNTLLDGITLIWQRLFDGAVSYKTLAEYIAITNISCLCHSNKRLPRRTICFQTESLPLYKLPGEFPQGVCLYRLPSAMLYE